MTTNKNYNVVADEVYIGKGVRIGDGVSISGGFDFTTGELKPAEKIVIGDGVFLGHDIEIACPSIEIGDYTMIREDTKITGRKEAKLGSCCWIGQNYITKTDMCPKLAMCTDPNVVANVQATMRVQDAILTDPAATP